MYLYFHQLRVSMEHHERVRLAWSTTSVSVITLRLIARLVFSGELGVGEVSSSSQGDSVSIEPLTVTSPALCHPNL